MYCTPHHSLFQSTGMIIAYINIGGFLFVSSIPHLCCSCWKSLILLSSRTHAVDSMVESFQFANQYMYSFAPCYGVDKHEHITLDNVNKIYIYRFMMANQQHTLAQHRHRHYVANTQSIWPDTDRILSISSLLLLLCFFGQQNFHQHQKRNGKSEQSRKSVAQIHTHAHAHAVVQILLTFNDIENALSDRRTDLHLRCIGK